MFFSCNEEYANTERNAVQKKSYSSISTPAVARLHKITSKTNPVMVLIKSDRSNTEAGD